MRLNPDCIRDILLSVEETTRIDVMYIYELNERAGTRLGMYDNEEIRYHVRQCDMAGLITGYQEWNGGEYIKIHDLKPAGHEFLANIRSDSVWNKTKKIAAEIGVGSLQAIVQIAGAVITEIIKAQLGLI